ncbi:MAG TPA: hypothetical protein VGJ87_03160 [Roseiflexaceae bacterium]|jgi:hypothetical protein
MLTVTTWRSSVRLDAGGGIPDDINWLIGRGYQLHTEDFSTARARRLAARVSDWLDDPAIPGRQVG